MNAPHHSRQESAARQPDANPASAGATAPAAGAALRLFLCGDVMTGRGIDQVLAQPSSPQLFEGYITDARDYVRLAEREHGPIPRPVAPAYPWGDALAEIDAMAPRLRIVNLETAVTTCDDAWPGKGINYRMHPANVGCLTAARIDACALANNHVLDWGHDGLAETLRTLHDAGIRTAGAGADAAAAAAPAVFELGDGARLLLAAAATESSGVPRAWRATSDSAGVNQLPDLGAAGLRALLAPLQAMRRDDDIAIVSLHWGGNWGYAIGRDERAFAHALVDAGVDLVHGHSSHHARGFEIHRRRLILYGCGDFINDYEGIGGHEAYRGDLAVAYFAELGRGGELQGLTLTPFTARRFSLRRAAAADVRWLLATLRRECGPLGVRLESGDDGRIRAEAMP
jgi:poly-gamma-glutamate capsule biosynthesis protein CapA/YwtB (metallophosphatase superfamily)